MSFKFHLLKEPYNHESCLQKTIIFNLINNSRICFQECFSSILMHYYNNDASGRVNMIQDMILGLRGLFPFLFEQNLFSSYNFRPGTSELVRK